jgi:hypothetical protein
MAEQAALGMARSIDSAAKALSALAGISFFMAAVIALSALARSLFNTRSSGQTSSSR